jgi:hypothetical protein
VDVPGPEIYFFFFAAFFFVAFFAFFLAAILNSPPRSIRSKAARTGDAGDTSQDRVERGHFGSSAELPSAPRGLAVGEAASVPCIDLTGDSSSQHAVKYDFKYFDEIVECG